MRHIVRTQIGSYERNVLGRPIVSAWTNALEVEKSLAMLRAIAVDLRYLQGAAYDVSLVDRLRGFYRGAVAQAKLHNVRIPKLETSEGIEDDGAAR